MRGDATRAGTPGGEALEVSIVVPTRNRSALLVRTLRSVVRQEDVGIEVIVVDEASTDDTASVVASFADDRIRVIRHGMPRGLPAARNHGAEEARGEWLAFIDDDDLWAPRKLIQQIEAARQAGRDWAYTGAVNFEGHRIVHGRPPLPPEDVVPALRRYNPIPGGGSNVIVRRATWLRAGPFEPRFRCGGEDWEMSLRLSRHGAPAWVCSPLMAKRVHPSNMSLDVAEIVRATQLIESLHGTVADWGRVHRWMAERYLRTGHRRAALGQLARAAARGQLAGAAADLGAILGRRMARRREAPGMGERGGAADAWTGTALTWLRELEPGVS